MTRQTEPPDDAGVTKVGSLAQQFSRMWLPVSAAAVLAGAAALAEPAPSSQAPAQPSPAQTLDRLFGLLAVAPDEQSASAVEEAIQGQWIAEATPATKLLLLHGFRELTDNQPNEALDDFDASLDLQPELPEGWHGRALARARLGDTAGAERDIEEVIRREPRQFAALEDLSRIAESAGDWRGAYAAWQQALALDPKAQGGVDRLKDLHRRAFGDAT